MSLLYVLDVVDFWPLVEVAAKNPNVTVRKRGPYFQIQCDGAFDIDRDATGCRNAVWFSSVAAIRDARITLWNQDVMRIEPPPGLRSGVRGADQ